MRLVKRLILRYGAVPLLLPLLAACGGLEALVIPAAMIEGGSLITTEKTASDHILSLYSGKDCSSSRVEEGRTYCREDEAGPKAPVYCYRSLGEITCYDRPDPYGDGAAPVGAGEATERGL